MRFRRQEGDFAFQSLRLNGARFFCNEIFTTKRRLKGEFPYNYGTIPYRDSTPNISYMCTVSRHIFYSESSYCIVRKRLLFVVNPRIIVYSF